MIAAVVFCASIHFTLSLPSQPVKLPPVVANNNLYANQNAYNNNGNIKELKENSQIQAARQNLNPPRKYNVNHQGPARQDLVIRPQKPLLEGPFYPAKPVATQQHINVLLAQNVQAPKQIITNNRLPSIPTINRPTISEPRPNTQTFSNNKRNNIIPSPLHEPLIATPRKKAYTIIHPNGTIEESDNLEDIRKVYPNYVLVNSNDVQNRVPVKSVNPVTTSPERVHAKNPLANPTIVPLFNKPISKTKPNELPRETLFTNTSEDSKTDIKTPLITNKLITKPEDDETSKGNKNSSHAEKIDLQKDHHPPNVKETNAVNKRKEIPNVSPGLDTHTQNNTSTVTEKNISVNEDKTDPNTSNEHNLTADSLNVNVTNVNNTSEIDERVDGIVNVNTISLNTSSQNEVTANSTNSILQVNVTNGSETAETERELNDSQPESPVRHDTIIVKNDTELNPTNAEYNDIKDESVSAIAECIIQEEEDDDKIYVPNISLLKDNDINTPFWFNAADQSVWEMLLSKNNSSAVFFFVPSAVLEKNTSVTIYPNGTRVEETVVIRNEGDKPSVSRTIIITHEPDEKINDT